VDYLPEDVALFVRTLQIEIPASINQTRENVEAGLIRSEKRPTIFGSLLLEEELQSTEKGTKRLAAEGFAILGAGTETTASALAVITYHLLTKPHLLAKLTSELEQFGITKSPRELPTFPDLERLPYLGAVIQEGLRLSYGVASRTARIATEEDLIYRGEWNKKPVEHVIPRGYAVGMSAYIAHHDEAVFPSSDEFIPSGGLTSRTNAARRSRRVKWLSRRAAESV
jgi:cytochrome P450